MWARVVEVMLAFWLAISPFIFVEEVQGAIFWINHLGCAFLVALFALLSFWYRLRKMHLLTLAISLWLWGVGYLSFPETPTPAQQNLSILGLILLMVAIVPSHAHKLSPSWQRFVKKIDS